MAGIAIGASAGVLVLIAIVSLAKKELGLEEIESVRFFRLALRCIDDVGTSRYRRSISTTPCIARPRSRMSP